MRHFEVTNLTRGNRIGDRVALADTSLTRMFGLLGRRELDAGTGLWIRPSSGVHTVGMHFAIDVVGLDRNLRVVRLWPRLVPYRLTAICLKVASVLELHAGTIDGAGIAVGDQISIAAQA
jgi:uncharacterized membrane protein (UPF0127 family)